MPVEAIRLRNEHFSSETAVKHVGGLMAFGAFIGLSSQLSQQAGPVDHAGFLPAGVLAFQFIVGICMARLQPWTRIPGIMLSAIGLLHFPFGTLFCLMFLHSLMSRKGAFVLTPGYRAIVAATLQVRRHSKAAVWLLLFIVLLFAGLGVYALWAMSRA